MMLASFDSQRPTQQDALLSDVYSPKQLRRQPARDQGAGTGKAAGEARGAVERRPNKLVANCSARVRQRCVRNPRRSISSRRKTIPTRRFLYRSGKDSQAIAGAALWAADEASWKRMLAKRRASLPRRAGIVETESK